MKNKNLRQVLTLFLSTGLLVTGVVGCGTTTEKKSSDHTTVADGQTNDNTKKDGDVTVITIGCSAGTGYQSFLDDNDHLTGATIETYRAIDELLEDYEFNLVATQFDDVFVGLQSGAYQGGEANCFLTQERIDKYAISEENISASYIGILVRKENAEGIESFADVATAQKESGKTFYPMQAGNGLTYPVEVYNEENPDHAIEFDYVTDNTNSDVLQWIVNGRYDFGLALYSSWQKNFVLEDGAYHEYYEDMEWIPVQNVGVYTLFNPEAIPDGFLEAYTDALKTLKENGKASEIAESFFGYDIFSDEINDLTD